MSKVCEICGKSKASGNNVSHSNRKTKRVYIPNLQTVTIFENGIAKKIKVCGKCIKTLGKKSK